jgi:hypothetical protein
MFVCVEDEIDSYRPTITLLCIDRLVRDVANEVRCLRFKFDENERETQNDDV